MAYASGDDVYVWNETEDRENVKKVQGNNIVCWNAIGNNILIGKESKEDIVESDVQGKIKESFLKENKLVVVCEDLFVNKYDLESFEKISIKLSNKGRVECVTWICGKEGVKMITSDEKNAIKIWDIEGLGCEEIELKEEFKSNRITCLNSFHSDILVGTDSGHIFKIKVGNQKNDEIIDKDLNKDNKCQPTEKFHELQLTEFSGGGFIEQIFFLKEMIGIKLKNFVKILSLKKRLIRKENEQALIQSDLNKIILLDNERKFEIKEDFEIKEFSGSKNRFAVSNLEDIKIYEDFKQKISLKENHQRIYMINEASDTDNEKSDGKGKINKSSIIGKKNPQSFLAIVDFNSLKIFDWKKGETISALAFEEIILESICFNDKIILINSNRELILIKFDKIVETMKLDFNHEIYQIEMNENFVGISSSKSITFIYKENQLFLLNLNTFKYSSFSINSDYFVFDSKFPNLMLIQSTNIVQILNFYKLKVSFGFITNILELEIFSTRYIYEISRSTNEISESENAPANATKTFQIMFSNFNYFSILVLENNDFCLKRIDFNFDFSLDFLYGILINGKFFKVEDEKILKIMAKFYLNNFEKNYEILKECLIKLKKPIFILTGDLSRDKMIIKYILGIPNESESNIIEDKGNIPVINEKSHFNIEKLPNDKNTMPKNNKIDIETNFATPYFQGDDELDREICNLKNSMENIQLLKNSFSNKSCLLLNYPEAYRIVGRLEFDGKINNNDFPSLSCFETSNSFNLFKGQLLESVGLISEADMYYKKSNNYFYSNKLSNSVFNIDQIDDKMTLFHVAKSLQTSNVNS
ncbi:hypothetical protein ROZALSC1DRAFT_20969 [Rozella allomycis CSF55]|uniref:WD40 repeat-like protein n=1 Tax=Rozella allomycis (strain CSF55) TaxID=988480 RepID=A0A4P9YNS7_ROZAC|nr:hypothetical protein ROZALSC1DRAFT_20969 [Rozella allomycis CSF55]